MSTTYFIGIRTPSIRKLMILICMCSSFYIYSQTSLVYLLTDSHAEKDNQHPALLALQNAGSETGLFSPFTVPQSTCPSSFDVPGYHYFDNAGLRFANNQFISCEYTIQFTFHIKELSGPQNWVRLLNFTPSDDNGIYIKITNGPTNGTLEFWPNGTVGADNFFNAVDLYQFVITRSCAGLVNIYVNGEFFADYDDSSNSLYLVNSNDDLIDFFQDDTAVPNEASPGWVKNIVIADFVQNQAFVEEEWTKFCEVLQDTDCSGIVGGTAILDECGVCLEPSSPDFNQSCFDCAGVLNGTAILDSCGVCLEQSDPTFNSSCADCAGTPNGTAVIDDCGECHEPESDDYNQACADCLRVPNGSAIVDECGVCLLPEDPEFNKSCLDCAGVINGTSVVDECGICLEPDSPEFNKSCTIQFYFPTGFSPNEDGINDVFEVYKSTDAIASIQTFRIYSRWGDLIFESRNFEFGDSAKFWDGSRNGQKLSNGVYVYVMEVLFENGTVKSYVGDVAILN